MLDSVGFCSRLKACPQGPVTSADLIHQGFRPVRQIEGGGQEDAGHPTMVSRTEILRQGQKWDRQNQGPLQSTEVCWKLYIT